MGQSAHYAMVAGKCSLASSSQDGGGSSAATGRSNPGGTSILGGRGAWPQTLLPKFLLEPQILPPK